MAVTAATLFLASSASAIQLAGSDFEIDTDANLILDADNDGTIDWATVPQGTTQGTERRKADLPTGSGDDSFGQGSKEDTEVPTVVDGSIPPNKSDLKTFGGYLETTATGARFLNIYWHRVQDPSGTTNMDFEFNKGTALSTNGVTPIRSAGDALIQYDLANGGTNPELFLSRWVTSGPGSQCVASNSTPCWGNTTASGLPPRQNLTASGLATGSINTSPISAANSDGLGAMDPRTFGEAQIDFDALAGGSGECVAFGSAYLKSRSSDSFSAALKDFIAPLATNFSICGDVQITKHDDAEPPALLQGAAFDLVEDADPINNVGGPGVEDVTVAGDCVTSALGVCSITAISQGEYWVVETVAPTGHDPADPNYQHVTVVADTTVFVTFVNPRQRGAIELTKTRKHAADGPGDHPQSGVNFTIAGEPVVTDADGKACVDGLLFGSYDVVETVPAGYVADGDTTKSVTVDNSATCDGDPYEGETVAFGNTPLTNVTVSVDSQIDGGTASTISCVDANGVPTNGSTGALGDGAVTVPNLTPTAPGTTLTCTVVVDP
ncbi:MAG TPA: SpaA isopeptide-forming pilin-related protein [Microthrixaceae bacterium]|nr:SpaA isopeptide-forming pilin-related protein [Microthrixaceae bacterium]